MASPPRKKPAGAGKPSRKSLAEPQEAEAPNRSDESQAAAHARARKAKWEQLVLDLKEAEDFLCELAGAEKPKDAMRYLRHEVTVEPGTGLDNPSDLMRMVINQRRRQQQTVVPPTEWTKADLPSRWARAFGVSVRTLMRRIKGGKIRHKKMSEKSYMIAIDDLPEKERVKHRPLKN